MAVGLFLYAIIGFFGFWTHFAIVCGMNCQKATGGALIWPIVLVVVVVRSIKLFWKDFF